jgi:plastocyanin
VILPRTPIGLIVAALAATIAVQPVLNAQATEGKRVVVEIHKMEFVPHTVVVAPGDIVVWKNLDFVPHTVTSKDESWDSGTIEADNEWETTVTDDMPPDYYCRFHPSMGATLSINTE